MAFDLGNLLQQYLGGATTPSPQHVDNHFDQASQSVGGDLLGSALSAVFRSDQTPAFGQMAGQLFGQSNPNQQAGMLNTILAGMGPAVLGSLLNKGGAGGLGGLLGQLSGGGAAPQLTPAQASQLTPEQVQVIASHAEQADPSIVDQLGSFYAEHPALVKTLGTAALSIALAKIAEHQRA